MSLLKDLKLFTTAAHTCSYLPDRQAKTLFIDPLLNISPTLQTHLAEIGFRRSGSHTYRPHCESCMHCIPCRVSVDNFTFTKRFRRIIKRNADLSVIPINSIADNEFYDLYAQYINTRHKDGDMYPATREQYDSFLSSPCETTVFYAIREQKTLQGIIVCDRLQNALSAVYTFYQVNETRRSLGNFAILWQIEEARRLGLSYLYLGYWIRDCDKMNYKIQFRPLEMLFNGVWILLK